MHEARSTHVVVLLIGGESFIVPFAWKAQGNGSPNAEERKELMIIGCLVTGRLRSSTFALLLPLNRSLRHVI